MWYTTHAEAAAPGIVSTQVNTICCATPQRTAESRRLAPTPMIDDVMMWVDDTGIAYA